MEGANSIVYKARIVYATRQYDATGELKQVEWEGPVVVLKALRSALELQVDETSSAKHEEMLQKQAADYEVLKGMPPHPNIVEVVHHFAASSLLMRPFVEEVWLPYLASKTT